MTEQFISQPLQPLTAGADTAAMAAGGPGLPEQFRWGKETLTIEAVLDTRRDTGPCRHGSGERYVRKHWFTVKLVDGRQARIYFERRGRPPDTRQRWWLYTILTSDQPNHA